jgi:uncharacterized protein (DUF433 family)
VKEVYVSKRKLIRVDREIVSGTPVFDGTRVPVQTLFDHLKDDEALKPFLCGFPGVTKEQTLDMLQLLQALLNKEIDENTFGRVRYTGAQARVGRTHSRHRARLAMEQRQKRRVAAAR